MQINGHKIKVLMDKILQQCQTSNDVVKIIESMGLNPDDLDANRSRRKLALELVQYFNFRNEVEKIYDFLEEK